MVKLAAPRRVRTPESSITKPNTRASRISAGDQVRVVAGSKSGGFDAGVATRDALEAAASQ
jgi:hypothetical protein